MDGTAASGATARRGLKPLWLIVLSAAACVGMAVGLRQVMGFYLQPVTASIGTGRESFGLAMAIANIVWGLGSPFAGAISDKFGAGRVVLAGAACTAFGLYLMTVVHAEWVLNLSGVFLGLGIAGTGISSLVGVVGRLSPPAERAKSIAAVSLGGGIGALIALPYTHILIEGLGWKGSLWALAATFALMIPLAWGVSGKPAAQNPLVKKQTLKEALGEAFNHPSFWLLTAGFFVCGFHVTFYGVHLPAFVADQGLPAWAGVWALIMVGVGNMIGTWLSGESAKHFPKRYGLSFIYFMRCFVFLGLLYLPITPVTIIALSFVLGLFWLSTIPLTSAMISTFFGPVWMSMLYGIVFLSHQVGSFLGVWMAGYLYDVTKSYDIMWWISVALGLFAALVHLPIREAPVARLAGQAAT